MVCTHTLGAKTKLSFTKLLWLAVLSDNEKSNGYRKCMVSFHHRVWVGKHQDTVRRVLVSKTSEESSMAWLLHVLFQNIDHEPVVIW